MLYVKFSIFARWVHERPNLEQKLNFGLAIYASDNTLVG